MLFDFVVGLGADFCNNKSNLTFHIAVAYSCVSFNTYHDEMCLKYWLQIFTAYIMCVIIEVCERLFIFRCCRNPVKLLLKQFCLSVFSNKSRMDKRILIKYDIGEFL